MDGSLIFLFAVVIIVGVLLFAIVTFGKRGGHLDVTKYRSNWMSVEQGLERDNTASYYKAIMDADKLVDQALKEKGFKGQSMGERLKSAKDSLPHRNDIWTAHKLRNQIAHEPNFKIDYMAARRALAQFKQTLKDLGAI